MGIPNEEPITPPHPAGRQPRHEQSFRPPAQSTKFIVSFVNQNEFPPTIREIGEQVGISSTSVVNYNLAKLEELDLIARRKEVSRGLSLNWDRIRELKPAIAAAVSQAQSNVTASAVRFAESLVRVPVLGPIAAGEPIQVEPFEAANTDDWVDVPENLFRSDSPLSPCAPRRLDD